LFSNPCVGNREAEAFGTNEIEERIDPDEGIGIANGVEKDDFVNLADIGVTDMCWEFTLTAKELFTEGCANADVAESWDLWFPMEALLETVFTEGV
jgi:hypothetical protein